MRRINQDVERIAEAEAYTMMTFPDKILESWEAIEANIRNQLDVKIKIESNKLKNTFAR